MPLIIGPLIIGPKVIVLKRAGFFHEPDEFRIFLYKVLTVILSALN